MKCPNCDADNPDASIFCGDCGAPLAGSAPEPEAPGLPVAAKDSVRCHRCGAENPAGAVLCSTCHGTLGAPTAGTGAEQQGEEPGALKLPDPDDALDYCQGFVKDVGAVIKDFLEAMTDRVDY